MSDYSRMQRRLRRESLQGPWEHIDLSRLVRKEAPQQEEPEPEPIEPKIGVGQHTLLLADTGAGKTNVIRWHLNDLLPEIAAGKRSVILIDPMQKGILTAELLRMRQIYEMRDRVVLIEPFDAPASINIFHLYERTPYALRQAIEKIERTLGTVAVDITKNQAIPFKFALHAVFALPQDRRDIPNLQRILAKGIDGLPVNTDRLLEPAQRFYENFKEGIRSSEVVDKLNAFLNDEVYAALFNPKAESFDIHKAMQEGKLIIIDASRADKTYGQFWIEEIAATIGRRLELIKNTQWVTPTSLIIDEAQEYIGDSREFGRILNKAREAKLSAFVAFHNLAQIDDDAIAASIIQQTHIKLVARTYSRLSLLCSTMGETDPETVKRLPKYHFAYFAPDMDTAETVSMPLVEFDTMPQCSERQTEELRRHQTLPPAPQRETRRPTGVQTETGRIPQPEAPPPPPPPETPQRRTLKPRK